MQSFIILYKAAASGELEVLKKIHTDIRASTYYEEVILQKCNMHFNSHILASISNIYKSRKFVPTQ